MTLSLTNETKNSLTITNESDPHADMTLADADWTLEEAEGTLGSPKMVLSKETKNNLSITNETK